jgi:predicted NBD/HSP70 family sugar kinase
VSAGGGSPKATPRLLKNLNERAVLEQIRTAAPISRAEISRRLGISKPTVSLALESLVDTELVREAGHPGGPSYGAVFFEAVPEAALVLGLDLGTRFLRGAVCDLDGRTRARQDVELGSPDVDTALRAIAALRESLVRGSALDDIPIDTAVLGVPGVVDTSSGRVSLAANIPGLEQREFGSEVRDHLGIDVVLENDINLAALGEQWAGVARGVADFAFLSIGAGLGCGIVLRGELHRGHNGAAGELDFVRAGFGDQLDPCAGALAELAAESSRGHSGTTILAPPYDPRGVFAAARQGDPLARTIVDEEARRIALHIVPLAAAADVGLVVLGGGLGANGDLLLEPIGRLLATWLTYPPRVEVSSLGEAAVLTGALAVGLRSALDNVFENRRHRREPVRVPAI